MKFHYFILLSIILLLFSCKSEDEPKEIIYPTAELLQNLSDLNLFEGNLNDLKPSETVKIYDLQTELFTDYCHKIRFLSIPKGEQMIYNDGGFPIYPDNTILAKTFYYNVDEQNLNSGKKIIETRVLIKKAGIWEIGNYVWNENQTDAIRDEQEHIIPINWKDSQGNNQSIDYVVPDYASCIKCHANDGVRVPIGPKIRNMNTADKLQEFIDSGILTGIDNLSTVEKLPKWNDSSYSLEERARAYLDVNCAHCHQPKGFYDQQFGSTFEFRYETKFTDTHILDKRDPMITRMHSNIDGYKMPFIGTTITHIEGLDLVETYLNSL